MPSVIPTLQYDDARRAIDFLERAFGFERTAVHEDGGRVAHAELTYGDGMVMLGDVKPQDDRFRTGRAVTYVVVTDADAHHARAVEAGAEVVQPLTDQDYGSREYAALDPEGNVWSFGTYAPSSG
jgi:uncharacterized glyoxalase superfamily protein PhnB